ncbi:hypothetical protein [Amycolatopsis sp. H20-H5]|uniref:hypothetical protein n=1 Tax=Amycolatopsis sp. H20-H5 TaxID=3046309 RepID=UPI002DB60958|nr:hypothetical protein [Amycolatopsis sp. H20-H5]MEC3975948.1 hypothetical protein [Amycolatopsis sp. H20-H5]
MLELTLEQVLAGVRAVGTPELIEAVASEPEESYPQRRITVEPLYRLFERRTTTEPADVPAGRYARRFVAALADYRGGHVIAVDVYTASRKDAFVLFDEETAVPLCMLPGNGSLLDQDPDRA